MHKRFITFFIKNDDLWQFLLKGKGRLYDTFNFKEMNIFDTLNENTNQMHK